MLLNIKSDSTPQFDQQQFRDVFNFLDKNTKDGIITKDDILLLYDKINKDSLPGLFNSQKERFMQENNIDINLEEFSNTIYKELKKLGNVETFCESLQIISNPEMHVEIKKLQEICCSSNHNNEQNQLSIDEFECLVKNFVKLSEDGRSVLDVKKWIDTFFFKIENKSLPA